MRIFLAVLDRLRKPLLKRNALRIAPCRSSSIPMGRRLLVRGTALHEHLHITRNFGSSQTKGPIETLLHPVLFFAGQETGEKKSIHHHHGTPLSRSVARPRGHRGKKAMVYTIFLGRQGKRVYTIGPERRVYTIEPQTRKKKKRRVSAVVVYTFFLP